MAEIGSDHDIGITHEIGDPVVDPLLQFGGHRIVIDIIDLKQLAHVRRVDETPLARGRRSGAHDVMQAYIRR